MVVKKFNSASVGFRNQFPQGTRSIITDVQFTPAHNLGEQIDPFPGKYKALWDTGASSTTISNEIANRLNLPILNDDIEISCPSGIYKTKLYLLGIILPNNLVISDIQVVGTEQSPKFDMLIGMDIITLGDFLISTVNGEPQFSFQIPSLGGFFLEGIKEVQTRIGVARLTQQPILRPDKVDRNDPCPCGSGLKFKKCHGKP